MTDVRALAAQIVAAHVGHNAVSTTALPALITTVFDTLSHLGEDLPEMAEQLPAVPIKKSIFPDYIVCLEDGKKMKMRIPGSCRPGFREIVARASGMKSPAIPT